jgi:hypothetical protein
MSGIRFPGGDNLREQKYRTWNYAAMALLSAGNFKRIARFRNRFDTLSMTLLYNG